MPFTNRPLSSLPNRLAISMASLIETIGGTVGADLDTHAVEASRRPVKFLARAGGYQRASAKRNQHQR
jgi:hypothetical protein